MEIVGPDGSYQLVPTFKTDLIRNDEARRFWVDVFVVKTFTGSL